jgi:hypothetical protein
MDTKATDERREIGIKSKTHYLNQDAKVTLVERLDLLGPVYTGSLPKENKDRPGHARAT